MSTSEMKTRARSLYNSWKDPQQKRRELYEHSVRQHEKLYQKVSFLDPPDADTRRYKYSAELLMPYLYFYKLLAKKETGNDGDIPDRHRLQLNIPDTVVYNDGDLPMMWFYTDLRTGLVHRTDNTGSRQVLAKFTQRTCDDEIVCVLKKTGYGSQGLQGNDLKLFTSSELKQNILTIGANRGEINVLQRYVKCNGNKPYIVRTVWHKDKKPECWVITSNTDYSAKDPRVLQQYKYVTVPKVRKACSIFRSTNSGFLKQTVVYIDNIRRYLLRQIQVNFQEFAADFIKDQGGNWWFINVRGFVLDSPPQKINIKPITMFGDWEPPTESQSPRKGIDHYQKCRNCKYCNRVYPDHLMNHRLTLIMLLQADKHLLARGKTFPWLQRCFTQHIGNVNLYIEHKVCDSCYTLYKEIQRLMRLEVQFARMLGISVSEDNKNLVSITALPAFKGHPPQFGSRLQKNTYEQTMPNNWGLPPGTNLQIQQNVRTNSTISKLRLMVLIHSFRDVPSEAIGRSYSIEYEMFDTRIRYPLDMQDAKLLSNDMLSFKVDKIRVFFFFARDRKSLNAFLKQQRTLKMHLLESGEKIGDLQMQLDDFLSDKVIKREYYKMFSGKEIKPLLSWGTNITLGLHDSGIIDVSNLKLHDHHGVYLHDNADYYTCDPLPEEWVNVIQEKQKTTRPYKTEPMEENIVVSQQSFGGESEKVKPFQATSHEKPFLNHDMRKEILSYSRRRTHSSHGKKKIYF